MNYREYLLSCQIYKKRTFLFALLNILLLLSVLVFHKKTWQDRFTMTIGILLLGIIITHIAKKIFKARQIHLRKIEQIVGDELIYHRADHFIGIFKGNRWGYLILLLIYSFLLLFILVLLYSELLSSLAVAVILGAMHLVLIMPILFSLNRLDTSACLFTSKTLIVNRARLISYENIKKYQFIELIKGGYVLDINSMDGFARLKIEEAQYLDIKKWISNYA